MKASGFVGRSAPLVFLLALLPGCAGMDVSQTIDLARAATSAAQALRPFSLEEEVGIGRSVAALVAGRYGVDDDEALTEYISLVGLTCAANARRREIVYHFAVLDTDEINAYAAPGGYVFITRGALGELKNEAELAGLLSHEIAHIDDEHVLKGIQKENLTAAGVSLADASGKLPDTLINAAGSFGADMLFKGYSRQDEYGADRLGTDILYRSGYPADGLLTYLERLDGRKTQGAFQVILSTHPETKERIDKVRARIDEHGYREGERPSLEGRYSRHSG